MNIATIEQIREDAKDGVFGNGQYLYSDSSADMGSGESFLKFLELAKKHRPAEKSFLIVADHGGSYKGIGWDEITKNKLGMSDIDQSLRQVALPLTRSCSMRAIWDQWKWARPSNPIPALCWDRKRPSGADLSMKR